MGKAHECPAVKKVKLLRIDQVLETDGYRKRRHIGGELSSLSRELEGVKIKQQDYSTKMGIKDETLPEESDRVYVLLALAVEGGFEPPRGS